MLSVADRLLTMSSESVKLLHFAFLNFKFLMYFEQCLSTDIFQAQCIFHEALAGKLISGFQCRVIGQDDWSSLLQQLIRKNTAAFCRCIDMQT